MAVNLNYKIFLGDQSWSVYVEQEIIKIIYFHFLFRICVILALCYYILLITHDAWWVITNFTVQYFTKSGRWLNINKSVISIGHINEIIRKIIIAAAVIHYFKELMII